MAPTASVGLGRRVVNKWNPWLPEDLGGSRTEPQRVVGERLPFTVPLRAKRRSAGLNFGFPLPEAPLLHVVACPLATLAVCFTLHTVQARVLLSDVLREALASEPSVVSSPI
jgi:hypothetical protein